MSAIEPMTAMRRFLSRIRGAIILGVTASMLVVAAGDDGGSSTPRFQPDGVVRALLFSPDSRWLAVHNQYEGSRYFTQLWGVGDTFTAERVQVLGGGAPFAFSADSKLIATTYAPSGMQILREGQSPPGPSVFIYDVSGRPSTKPRHVLAPRSIPRKLLFVGATLIGVDEDGDARVWDVETGALESKEAWGTMHVAHDAGRSLLAIADGRRLSVRDAATRRVLRERALDGAPIEEIAFSPDGTALAITTRAGDSAPEPVLTLYDAATLAVRRRLTSTRLVAVLADGRIVTRSDATAALVESFSTGSAALRRAGTYDVQRTLPDDTNALYPSPDNRLVLDVSGGVVRFRSPRDWTPTAFWLPVAASNTAQPMIVTPGGHFDGAPGNWASLSWEFSDAPGQFIAVDRFVKDYYRPGLLAEVIAGRPPRPDQGLQRLDRRQPELSLSLSGAPPMFSSRTIDLAIRVTRAPAGGRDLRLLRNGVMIRRWHGEIRPGADPIVATVPVTPDRNEFTAYLFNRDDVKSADATFAYHALLPPAREAARIVAFGVNRYNDARMQLRYAAPDATSFATQLASALAKTGEWDEVKQVTLLDRDVTRASILAALDQLAGKVAQGVHPRLAELGHARPADTVFVFFSGHGVTLGDRFYLLPHDAAPSRHQIAATAISDADLEQALEALDARHIVIIIDACHSGQALEAEDPRRGPLNVPGLAQLAYEKGMYVLVAAQPRQQAIEVARLGHGLLTYALLDGLGGAAAAADTDPANGVVDLVEWLDAAARRVPEVDLDLTPSASRTVTPDPDHGPARTAWEPQRARLYRRAGSQLDIPSIVDLVRRR